MNWYNPYVSNQHSPYDVNPYVSNQHSPYDVNPYSIQSQQVPQYPQTSYEQISRSELIKEAVPVLSNDSQYRAGRAFTVDFRGKNGFERRITNVPGVNENSIVVASISEIGISDGVVKPFQGAASLELHNIVPHKTDANRGFIIVRGNVGWESDLSFRISFVVF